MTFSFRTAYKHIASYVYIHDWYEKIVFRSRFNDPNSRNMQRVDEFLMSCRDVNEVAVTMGRGSEWKERTPELRDFFVFDIFLM